MKKLLVKASLMVGSVLMLGVAANAQMQYRAEIPFDFQAAGKVFTAGGYSVGQVSSGGAALVIRDRKSGRLTLLGHANLGGDGWRNTGKLIFIKADDRYTLTEIVTPSFAMKLKGTSTNVKMASDRKPKQENVAVKLH